MSVEAALVLVILGASFLLFVSGLLAPDLIAVAVLVALVLTGSVTPTQAFAGFSSLAVITIGALMVLGSGLERTGVVQWVAQRLEHWIQGSSRRLVALNTAIPGLLSGFVNIVAAASFFVPVILRLCRQLKVPQSKVLLPMATCALLGANLTLIGASHNLVVDGLLRGHTGEGLGFFEFTPVGVTLLGLGLIYAYTVGQRVLPGERVAPDPTDVPVTANLVEVYDLEDRLFEVWVSDPGEVDVPGPAEPTTVASIRFREAGLVPIAVVRDGRLLRLPQADEGLVPGDLLLVQGRPELVERLAEEDERLVFIGPPQSQERYPLSTGELAEAVVPPRSTTVGKTLGEIGLSEEFGMTPIAYYREGRPYRTGIEEVTLEEGDAILVYGPRDRMREFDPEKDLLIYFKPGEPEVSTEDRRKAPWAALVLLLVILGAAVDWMPIAATATAGALVMVLLGIVPVERVYRAIDWKSLVLVAGMFPLGEALGSSGAADAIGQALLAGLGDLGPRAVLAGVVGLTMLLTQPMHNAAVAVIMTPIAIQAATQVGADPRPFCVGVLVACSAAFLMPYGHPAPMLVEEPGGYRRADYLRYGLGLALLTLAVVLVLVPLLWPLTA